MVEDPRRKEPGTGRNGSNLVGTDQIRKRVTWWDRDWEDEEVKRKL